MSAYITRGKTVRREHYQGAIPLIGAGIAALGRKLIPKALGAVLGGAGRLLGRAPVRAVTKVLTSPGALAVGTGLTIGSGLTRLLPGRGPAMGGPGRPDRRFFKKDGTPRRLKANGQPWGIPSMNAANPRALRRSIRRLKAAKKLFTRAFRGLERPRTARKGAAACR